MSIKWGILGTGVIVRKFIDDFKLIDGDAEILGVASRSLERSEALAREHGFKKTYGSYDALIADGDVDVIYIGLTHDLHLFYALEAMRKGHAVLVEKPMALTEAQFDELERTAEENDVLFMEAMWTNHLPAMKKAIDWYREGRIGDLVRLEAHFGFRAVYDQEGRLFDKKRAGGALFDIGIYAVDFFTSVMQKEPEEIEALAGIGLTRVDELLDFMFRYNSQVIAHGAASLRNDYGNDAFLQGTGGSIRIFEFYGAKVCELKTDKGVERFRDHREGLGYLYEIEHVTSLLEKGEKQSPLTSREKSRINCRVMDRIRSKIGLRYDFDEKKIE
jgi:predicted dehydrogenase